MSSNVLKEYEQDGYYIIEYTRDGETVSASIKSLIGLDTNIDSPELQPTIEEMQAQTLINTEYLIAMNEMGIEGGKV